MGQIKWYKRDPHAALEGMRELTLEERGAYNTVLDLIYARDGRLPDDERFIAGYLGVDVRVWKRIRARLIDLGKLFAAVGCLHNAKALEVVDEALRRVACSSDAGKASARSRASKSKGDSKKNKDLGSTGVGTGDATGVSTIKNKSNTVETSVSTGADAPKAAPTAAEIKKAIFDSGKALLQLAGVKNPGAVIQRWRQTYPDIAILDAVTRCEGIGPENPVSWIASQLQLQPTRKETGYAQGNPPCPDDGREMGRTEAAARELLADLPQPERPELRVVAGGA